MYGWCITLTFILYIFYDLANLLSLHISQETLDILFFMATLSILWAIWNIFLEVGQSSTGPAEEFGIDPHLGSAEGHWADGQTGRVSFLKEGKPCKSDDL